MLGRSMTCGAFLLFFGACATAPPRAAPSSVTATSAAPAVGDLSKVGHIELPNSCVASVAPELLRGVALLHSFFYEEARRIFTGVAAADPSCAMAQWGIAMTYWHPIWAAPEDADFQSGLAASDRASALTTSLPLERELVAAIAAFYRSPAVGEPNAPSQTCHGVVAGDIRGRALAYEKAMAEVHARHPHDVEPAAFYALALLATAPPTDVKYANQLKATALLEPFFVSQPNHPGVAHYLIHGYDYPELATRGLPAARAYAGMAPWVPHALHMPSHIFTRLGFWDESIASNLGSANASHRYQIMRGRTAVETEELHALDYLVYAYLQTAEDKKALAIVERVRTVTETYPAREIAGSYALGAIPARYALERRQWAEAAALPDPSPVAAQFAFSAANIELARAIGAARSGDPERASRAAERLRALGESLREPRFGFFARQVQMQATAASAWLAQSRGDSVSALEQMRKAAQLEDLLGKHPVTPGSVIPARELLGELLLEQHQPVEARREFEASLHDYPARFTLLYGAGRAAAAAGDTPGARAHFTALIALAGHGDGTRPELEEARRFIAKP
jgi:hypothetical protein